MAKNQFASAEHYAGKLARVMERLGVDFKDANRQKRDYNWNFDRFGCWVEFRLKGELYRFDHSIEKARARGILLQNGSDAFAQVVLALEDLARMVERGVYDLSTWVAGMKYLPPPLEVPGFFESLGFAEIPSGPEEVFARYRSLAKALPPEAGGNGNEFMRLKNAAEQAARYFGKT